MPIRAIIFDLDGTLLDSIGGIAVCGNEALAVCGFPALDVELYKAYVGNGVAHLARKILPEGKRDDETMRRFLSVYRELYRTGCHAQTKPYPGVPELLSAITQRGVRMAVISNKRDELTKTCVAELLPSFPFAEVRGESEDTPAKPDPSGTLEVARRLGVLPESCLFVGDTEVDAETARRAGMRFVAVEWGYRSRAQLQTAGAERFVREPAELLQLLD